jgi:hypothetical protein
MVTRHLKLECIVTSFLLKLGYNPKPSRADCTRRCGNISVPFPFGLEEGCFAREQFHLNCTNAILSAILKSPYQYQVISLNVDEGIMNYTQKIDEVNMDLFVGNGAISSVQWVVANLSCIEAKQNTSGYACVNIDSSCVEVNSSGEYIGYRCKCPNGFQGNPYVQSGCQGIC